MRLDLEFRVNECEIATRENIKEIEIFDRYNPLLLTKMNILKNIYGRIYFLSKIEF